MGKKKFIPVSVDMKIVGPFLKHRMALKGMTQASLKDQLGVHLTTLSRRLSGNLATSVEDFERLCAAIGIEGDPKLIERMAQTMNVQTNKVSVFSIIDINSSLAREVIARRNLPGVLICAASTPVNIGQEYTVLQFGSADGINDYLVIPPGQTAEGWYKLERDLRALLGIKD